MSNVDASYNAMLGVFITAGSAIQTISFGEGNPGAMFSSGGTLRLSGSGIFNLAAGDTITTSLVITGGVGDQIDISGIALSDYTSFFSGSLAF